MSIKWSPRAVYDKDKDTPRSYSFVSYPVCLSKSCVLIDATDNEVTSQKFRDHKLSDESYIENKVLKSYNLCAIVKTN